MKDRKDYFLQYKKDNYKRIPLDVTKDFYELIKEHTAERKEPINHFIKRAIKHQIEDDNKNDSLQ